MGMLIAVAAIVLGSIVIGIAGGVYAGRAQQWVLPVAMTLVGYYLLVGVPWAWLIMESDGNALRGFMEAFIALARSLLLLGLVPLLVSFAIAVAVAR